MNGEQYATWDKHNELYSRVQEDEKIIVSLETHIKRILSDIESEKGTRNRMNAEFIRQLEFDRQRGDARHDQNQRMMIRIWKTIGVGTGIILTVMTLLKFLV